MLAASLMARQVHRAVGKESGESLAQRMCCGTDMSLGFEKEPVSVRFCEMIRRRAEAMLHKLPGTTDTLPSVVADAHAAGLSALPAAVLARILLSCDLTGLCCLAAAASLFCLGSSDVGEAMPLPCEKGPDRWLSFARASLLWADLLACLHLGSAKVAQRFQQLARQARVAPSAWITGSGQATAASF